MSDYLSIHCFCGLKMLHGVAPHPTPLRILAREYKHDALASGSEEVSRTHSLARRACITEIPSIENP